MDVVRRSLEAALWTCRRIAGGTYTVRGTSFSLRDLRGRGTSVPSADPDLRAVRVPDPAEPEVGRRSAWLLIKMAKESQTWSSEGRSTTPSGSSGRRILKEPADSVRYRNFPALLAVPHRPRAPAQHGVLSVIELETLGSVGRRLLVALVAEGPPGREHHRSDRGSESGEYQCPFR